MELCLSLDDDAYIKREIERERDRDRGRDNVVIVKDNVVRCWYKVDTFRSWCTVCYLRRLSVHLYSMLINLFKHIHAHTHTALANDSLGIQ